MFSSAYAQKRQFPLHIHISVVFTLLLVLIGVTLGVINYLQTTRIILGNSQKLFNQIEHDVQLDLVNTYRPIRQTLNLLALTPAIRTGPIRITNGVVEAVRAITQGQSRARGFILGR